MRLHAVAVQGLGEPRVLIKGGHREDGPDAVDLFLDIDGETSLRAPRVDTLNTHGTGCTLATAIACGLADGMALPEAVARAHDFVQQAIRTAPGLGAGQGPMNHRTSRAL